MERIQSGELPREAGAEILAGFVQDNLCALCQRPILGNEVEYVVQPVRGAIRFHICCHAIWKVAQIQIG
jgi:hypothetical protein